jgi:hypothetical protein
MKKQLFKGMAGLLMLTTAAMFTLTSCDKEDDPDPGPSLTNGYYLQGAATALTELTSDGKMSVAKNEVNQENLSSLLEMYIAIKAGSEGFNIVQVISGEETVLGPGSDFAEVSAEDLDGEEPREGLWKGSYTDSENSFTVPEDGLYHVVIDNSLEMVAIARVKWGLIGAATPGGWSGSTPLGEPAFDLNSMEFSSTELMMNTGEFKYRYSNGWKIVLSDEIKVNTNFGGAVDNLDAGGANITMDNPGVYTATLKWELSENATATLTRTGAAPLPVYSDYEVGLIGDGIWIAEADSANGWGSTYGKVLPTVDDTNYAWSWTDVEVRTSGAFKIRQGDNWDGLNLGYNDVTVAGSSASNFSEDGGNFKAAVDGTFDFVLSIDAAVGDFTLTVEPATE